MVLTQIITIYQTKVKDTFLFNNETKASLLADINRVKTALGQINLKKENLHYSPPEQINALAGRITSIIMGQIGPILQANSVTIEDGQEFSRLLVRAFLDIFKKN